MGTVIPYKANTLNIADKINTYMMAASYHAMSSGAHKLFLTPKMNYWGNDIYLRFIHSQGIAYSMNKFAPSSQHFSGVVNQAAKVSGFSKIWATTSADEHSEILRSDPNTLIKKIATKAGAVGKGIGWQIGKYFMNGPWFAKSQAAGTALGKIVVSDITQLSEGMYLTFEVADAADISGFVDEINLQGNISGYSSARLGSGQITIKNSNASTGAVVDLSSVAKGAKIYINGGAEDSVYALSLRDVVFPAAHGGSDTLYGEKKSSNRFLQSIYADGASFNTASKFLDGAEKLCTETAAKQKTKPDTFAVGEKRLNDLRKAVDSQNQGVMRREVTPSAYSHFPWETMRFRMATGWVNIIGMKELDEDVAFAIDNKSSIEGNDYDGSNKLGVMLTPGSLMKRGPTNNGEKFTTRNEALSLYSHIMDVYSMNNNVINPIRISGIYGLPDLNS